METELRRLSEIDNRLNGMNEWMLAHLRHILRWDFSEYNSKRYQRLSVAAIQNLDDFAWDQRVKLAARMVLDYVSAKTAVCSDGLRRAVPFRRQTKHQHQTELLGDEGDAESSRMLMLSGSRHIRP